LKLNVLKRREGAAGYGTKGSKIFLITNWFSLKLKTDVHVYHWDVSIEPVSTFEEKGKGKFVAPQPSAPVIPGLVVEKPKPKKIRIRKNKISQCNEQTTIGESDLDPAKQKVLIKRISKIKRRKIFQAFTLGNKELFQEHPFAFDGVKNAFCTNCPKDDKYDYCLNFTGDGEPPERFKVS